MRYAMVWVVILVTGCAAQHQALPTQAVIVTPTVPGVVVVPGCPPDAVTEWSEATSASVAELRIAMETITASLDSVPPGVLSGFDTAWGDFLDTPYPECAAAARGHFVEAADDFRVFVDAARSGDFEMADAHFAAMQADMQALEIEIGRLEVDR